MGYSPLNLQLAHHLDHIFATWHPRNQADQISSMLLSVDLRDMRTKRDHTKRARQCSLIQLIMTNSLWIYFSWDKQLTDLSITASTTLTYRLYHAIILYDSHQIYFQALRRAHFSRLLPPSWWDNVISSYETDVSKIPDSIFNLDFEYLDADLIPLILLLVCFLITASGYRPE